MSEEIARQIEEVRDGLMRTRTVTLTSEINDESVGDVIHRLLKLQLESSERINLIIDSEGGMTDAALRLCDLMTTVFNVPIRGIAVGECYSSATFILLHCSERVSTPYARFMIHSGTMRNIAVQIKETSSKDLEQLTVEVKATEERIRRLYMDRLTPNEPKGTEEEKRAFVQKLIDRGDQPFNEFMSAEEALEIGLVTKIVTENLGIFPPPE